MPPRILSLTLQAKSNTRRSEVAIEQAVVAGWTGRDPVAVEKHIKELEALGVKRPATTPIFFSRFANPMHVASTSFDVVFPRTISSSRMTLAGEKK